MFSYQEEADSRLQLNCIEIDANDGLEIKPKYSFDYFDDDDTTIKLPDYWTFKTDHWGYYNGQTAVFDYNDMASFYQAKQPGSLAELEEGVLSKITYPTGGYTEFEYQKHDYSYEVTRNGILDNEDIIGLDNITIESNESKYDAGGLRIYKITSKTDSNDPKPIETTYKYLKDKQATQISSGILTNKIYYEWSSIITEVDGIDRELYMASTIPKLPITNGSGSPVVYSDVFEERSDGSYTHYTYKTEPVDSNVEGSVGNDYYIPATSFELERGKIIRKLVYNDENTLIKKDTFIYDSDPNRFNYKVRAKVYNEYAICYEDFTFGDYRGSITLNQYAPFGVAKYIHTHPLHLIEHIETVFDLVGSNPVFSSNQYSYNDDKLLESQTVTGSDGEAIKTIYKYPCDYFGEGVIRPQDCNSDVKPLLTMTKNNIINEPIETVFQKGNMITGARLNFYTENTNGSVYKDRMFILETTDPLEIDLDGTNQSSKYNFSEINMNSSIWEFESDNYYPDQSTPNLKFSHNETGNLIQWQRNSDTKNSTIWGYNDTRPIAEIVNAKYGDVYHCNFEEAESVYGWHNNTSRVETNKHSGQYSIKSTNPWTQTNYIYHYLPLIDIDNSQTVKYKLSGWVYSEGPSVDLFAIYYETDTTVILGNSFIRTYETDKWVYLEKEFAVPTTAKKIRIRLDNRKCTACSGDGIVYYDDVRLHPADAQMTTYTHDPLIGVTSQSDANSQPIYYEYDDFGRLISVKDSDGNLIQDVEYNYANQ